MSPEFTRRSIPLLLLVTFGLTTVVARPDEPATQPAAKTIVVWYDVGDLVRANPEQKQFVPVLFEELEKLVKDVVDNASWKDNGGDVGSMAVYGRELIVTQTEQNQQNVKSLLTQLRRHSPDGGETISVDAYWVRLTPAQLTPGQTTVPAALLADPSAVYARARATGFNGQSVTASVEQYQTVVTAVQPIVAPGVPPIYDYTTESQKFGVSLVETPTHVEGENTIVLDVNSAVIMIPDPVPVEFSPPGPATRPDVAWNQGIKALRASGHTEQNVRTSVRLIPGVPTIVGGMTDKPGSPDGRTLCLVLCVSASQ